MNKQIKAFAPATVANVACGFDVLGFAVDSLGDEVTINLTKSPGVKIISITGDNGLLPLDTNKNTVSLVIRKYLSAIDRTDIGVEIELRKGMPLKSGLGSSAASSVVGVYALNELLGRPLKQIELLPFTVEGEKLACGSAHADNVAPALLGGFVLIRSYDPLDVITLPVPSNLFVTIVHPNVEVKTEYARSILPKKITLQDAIEQWGNVGGLIAGLFREDYELIGRSLKDVIVEPIRKTLIPGFDLIKQKALNAGALGCSISGSGPTIFALSKSEKIAKEIEKSMDTVYNGLSIANETFVSHVNSKGPRIIST